MSKSGLRTVKESELGSTSFGSPLSLSTKLFSSIDPISTIKSLPPTSPSPMVLSSLSVPLRTMVQQPTSTCPPRSRHLPFVSLSSASALRLQTLAWLRSWRSPYLLAGELSFPLSLYFLSFAKTDFVFFVFSDSPRLLLYKALLESLQARSPHRLSYRAPLSLRHP